MSRSARQTLNNGQSSYFEFVGEDDGNAARTRPIHFNEIMLRRKTKELSKSGNNININNEKRSTVKSFAGTSARHGNYRNGERIRGRPHLQSEVEKVKPKDRDDNSLVKEGNLSEIKKRKIAHHPEIFSKETGGNKERHASQRRDVIVKGNDKGVNDPESKFRTRLNSEVSYKDDRDDRSMQNQDKAVGHVRNEPNTLDGRDRITGSNVNQRYTVKGAGRAERETKRMRRDLDLGIAYDRYGAMKPDPRRLHDIDASQRLVWKELTESRYDEINAEKKLSESRKQGKNDQRRSLSLSPGGQRRQLDIGRRDEDHSSKSLKERSWRQLDDTEKSRISSNGSGKHYRSLDVSSGEVGRYSPRKREADKAVKTPSPSRRSPERKTSSSYRSYEVSKSGLGGYSPRKRRSDKAVKTPPPSKQSPEKKVAGWDIAPTGTQIVPGGPIPDTFPLSIQATSLNVHELTSAVSAALSVMKPSVVASLNVPPIKLSASIDSVQLTESTRPMRRLYIENIPASASEKALMHCLNSNLLSRGANHIHGTQPCISCIIHQEKGLALVEFLTPEDASSALSLDGCSFSGTILKVRRPKDFVDVAGVFVGTIIVHILDDDEADSYIRRFSRMGASVLFPSVSSKGSCFVVFVIGKVDAWISGFVGLRTSQTIDARKDDAVHVISDTVDDSPHKIFIGGISAVMTSEMLMEIAGVFGQLKGFHYAVSGDATERCAFLEYLDPSTTLMACAALNGINLGGQVLTVVQEDSSSSGIDENLPHYAIPNHARPLLQKPTRVLKMRNVFPPDGLLLLSQKEMDEIIEDVRLECARFGVVKTVNVVKHDISLPLMPEGCVVTSNTVQNERADRLDENYPTSDCCGDSENGMSQPDKEGNINYLTYQIHSDEGVAGESRQTNDLSDGCQNQDSQECDVTPHEDSHTEEKSPVDQESTLDEVEREFSPDPEPVGAPMTDIDIPKSADKEFLSNLDNIFEPGCVLVEYKRTESSCEAAHCLHGRLFDDRMVNVEYVPEDLYIAKFGKFK